MSDASEAIEELLEIHRSTNWSELPEPVEASLEDSFEALQRAVALEDVDEDLLDAVDAIPDADPTTISQYDDGGGHFLINSDADDQDVEEIDDALEDAGYERDGVLPAPEMVQQNFQPLDEGGDD